MEWDYVKQAPAGNVVGNIYAHRHFVPFDEIARILLANGQNSVVLYVNQELQGTIEPLMQAINNLKEVTQRVTADRITIVTCSNDMYGPGFLETMQQHVDSIDRQDPKIRAKWGIAPDVDQVLDRARKEITDLAR